MIFRQKSVILSEVVTKSKDLEKSGFTLMELLVYMAIVGIIVVVAGEAFSNSTKFRVRTQNMLKATQEAENVATLFKADVAQMGAKSSLEGGNAEGGAKNGLKFFKVCANDAEESEGGCVPRNIYMNSELATDPDSSSFQISTNNGKSDLLFRRARYDESGKYKAIEEVHWFVDDKTLYRRCYTIAGDEHFEGDGTDKVYICKDKPTTTDNEKNDAVEIATGVTKFDIIAASPSTSVDNVQVFPTPCTPAPCTDEFQLVTLPNEDKNVALKVGTGDGEFASGSSITLSQFFSNFSNDKDDGELLDKVNWKQNQVIAIESVTLSGSDSWKDRCAAHGIKVHGSGSDAVSLEANQEYEISFVISYQGKDSYGREDKSAMFVPGEDHMSVGLRSALTGNLLKKDGRVLVDDFMFYPPLNEDGGGRRSMRFTVNSPVKETFCISFTFASFSPLVSQGKVTIRDLKLNKIASSNYSFSTPFNAANVKEKKNVKALKLSLQVTRGAGETGEVEVVVPTPGNGPRD